MPLPAIARWAPSSSARGHHRLSAECSCRQPPAWRTCTAAGGSGSHLAHLPLRPGASAHVPLRLPCETPPPQEICKAGSGFPQARAYPQKRGSGTVTAVIEPDSSIPIAFRLVRPRDTPGPFPGARPGGRRRSSPSTSAPPTPSSWSKARESCSTNRRWPRWIRTGTSWASAGGEADAGTHAGGDPGGPPDEGRRDRELRHGREDASPLPPPSHRSLRSSRSSPPSSSASRPASPRSSAARCATRRVRPGSSGS